MPVVAATNTERKSSLCIRRIEMKKWKAVAGSDNSYNSIKSSQSKQQTPYLGPSEHTSYNHQIVPSIELSQSKYFKKVQHQYSSSSFMQTNQISHALTFRQKMRPISMKKFKE